MHDVLFISDSISRSIERASVISRAFNTLVLPPKTINSTHIRRAGVIVFDVILSKGQNALIVKDVLAQQKPVFACFTASNRLEKTQADALNGVRIFNRALPTKTLVAQIRAALRQLQTTKPTGNVAQLVNDVACSFEDICQTAVLGGPLPADRLAMTSATISDTLAKFSLTGFLSTLQEHHSHTTRHTLLVATMAADFCNGLQIRDETTEVMISGAIVHDIGKTSVPLAILDKPGALSQSEMDLIRQHPLHGFRILEKSNNIDPRIKALVLDHHELLDGSGYPHGKGEQDLDTNIRILTICDIFSALIEKRSYKPALPTAEALKILEDMGGKLDQALVREFKLLQTQQSGFAAVNALTRLKPSAA